jgi:hypothetical protein
MSVEISVSVEELRKRKIMVCTPMYGGLCTGQYARSTTDLGILGNQYGMDIRFFYLYNESLITRARNYLVDEFLRSDCTHLMFIDSDIGYDPNDVIALSVIAETGSQYHVVCGPYPKKCISWEKIKRAVDKGVADKNAEILENYVGDYVFNPANDTNHIRLDEPAEVLEGGTGFMMIQREVFDKFKEAHPDRSYLPDHVRTAHFDGSREITAYFDCVIDPKSKRYLSEDYMFCQYVRDLGMKVWLCPWMRLTHMGSYNFGGSLVDLAQIGVAATADPTAIGKKHLAK